MLHGGCHETRTADKARAQTMYMDVYIVTYKAMYMALYMVVRASVRVRLLERRIRGIIRHRNNLLAVHADCFPRGRNLGFGAHNLGFGLRNLGFSGRNLGFWTVTSVTASSRVRTYVVDRGYEPVFSIPYACAGARGVTGNPPRMKPGWLPGLG